jgi:hypothetical protein
VRQDRGLDTSGDAELLVDGEEALGVLEDAPHRDRAQAGDEDGGAQRLHVGPGPGQDMQAPQVVHDRGDAPAREAQPQRAQVAALFRARSEQEHRGHEEERDGDQVVGRLRGLGPLQDGVGGDGADGKSAHEGGGQAERAPPRGEGRAQQEDGGHRNGVGDARGHVAPEDGRLVEQERKRVGASQEPQPIEEGEEAEPWQRGLAVAPRSGVDGGGGGAGGEEEHAQAEFERVGAQHARDVRAGHLEQQGLGKGEHRRSEAILQPWPRARARRDGAVPLLSEYAVRTG